MSQNTVRTARPWASPGRKAGGDDASTQVAPASRLRNTVSPRCPVLAAISQVSSIGSVTRCLLDMAQMDRTVEIDPTGCVAPEDERALAGADDKTQGRAHSLTMTHRCHRVNRR
ncbi:MAG: hypothetical protein R2715_22050 [Ilumatobacteraceae bacterium]